jgi:imidazoleglycerol-phosphate dehydratase
VNAKIKRKTKETQIELALDLEGGAAKIDVPLPFLGHMLLSFAKHSGAGLTVTAKSLDKDDHHLAEDVAITLGRAIKEAVDGAAIKRFGHEVVPMDDALVGCYVDLGGRPYYEGALPEVLYEHVLRSLCHEAGLTCHVVVIRGRDPHHTVEAAFKALGRSLKQAWQKAADVQSTKGEVELSGG